MDLNIVKELCSIRGTISSDAQVTIFGGQCDQSTATVARNLLHGRITKLTTNDSVTSRSAFVAQHVHFCTKEEKTSKVIGVCRQRCPVHSYFIIYLHACPEFMVHSFIAAVD